MAYSPNNQYTEDAASPANPTGDVLLLVRDDTHDNTVSTDDDFSAAKCNTNGDLYVYDLDGETATYAVETAVNNLTTDVNNIFTSDFPTVVDRLNEISSNTSNTSTALLGDTTYTEGVTKGTLIAAIRRDADTTLVDTTNEFSPLQVDANGRLKVEVFSGETLPVSLTSTTITGTVAVTQSGTWDEVGINDSGNSITVDAPVATPVFVRLSDGSSAIATLPVSLASLPSLAAGTNNIGDVDVLTLPAIPTGANTIGSIASITTSIVPGTGATNLGKAIDTTTGATDTGVLLLATRDDDLGTLTPVDGDNVQFRTDSEGALWVTEKANATEGVSTLNSTSSDGGTALTSSAQAIKASAGCLYGYYIYNPNASAAFVQFYNTASGSVTVGTTNPLFMLTIPAGSAANLNLTPGVVFTTAMSWAATSTAGGNGAPTTALDAVAWYK